MSEPNYLDDDEYTEYYLEILKQKFEEGNKAFLLEAMHRCLLMRKPLPEWLRVAFIRAYESAAAFEIRSWDEAFGPPQEKGTHLETRRQHAKLQFPVAFHVHRMRATGRPVDKGMFEDIAEELKKDKELKEDGAEGIEATTVEKIYYKRGGKELHDMICVLFPDQANPAKK
jgi:hypothetical protein